MVWANIIAGAANTALGLSNRSDQRKLAKAQYNLDKQRAQNADLANASRNAMEMANADLERFNQRRNNWRTLDAAGEALSQMRWNLGKQVDALNSQKMGARLEGASQMGSLLAEASAAGVGGGSVDMVLETERFRNERIQNDISNQIKDAEYVGMMNELALADNTYYSLDFGYQFANLNYRARDMVTDNSWQYKNNLLNMGQDFANGFQFNFSQAGLDLSKFDQGSDTGSKNKGLGGKKGVSSSPKTGSTPSGAYNQAAGATRL